MKNNLFIGGLAHGVTNAQLEEHFAKAGKVLSAKVIIDRQTGLGKGFGFVEMSTEEEAKAAIKELNHTEIDGKSIEVKEAKPRE
jgi:RNA recognition motif-containing protein